MTFDVNTLLQIGALAVAGFSAYAAVKIRAEISELKVYCLETFMKKDDCIMAEMKRRNGPDNQHRL